MQCEQVTQILKILYFPEHLRSRQGLDHRFSLQHNSFGYLRQLSLRNNSQQGLLECQRQKLLFPTIGLSKAAAFSQVNHFFLLLWIGRSFIQSDFAIQYYIQTFSIFLTLIDETLLLELRQVHRVAEMVGDWWVPYLFNGLELCDRYSTASMILMRVLISATVRCLGSLISVSNSTRRSCFLRWSSASLLNRISSLLKIRSSCFSIIEISSKPFKVFYNNNECT